MENSADYLIRYSKDHNEPAWMLDERLKALKIFENFQRSYRIKVDESRIGEGYSEAGGVIAPYLEDFHDQDGVVRSKLSKRSLEYLNNEKKFKELFLSRLNKPHDYWSAYINAFFKECTLVFTPEGEKETKIDHQGLFSIRFIVADGDLKIIENAKGTSYYIQEVAVPENSRVEHFLSYNGENSVIYQSAILKSKSKFSFTSSLMSSIRLETKSVLEGDLSYSDNVNIFFLSQEEELYLNSILDHRGQNTRGNILIKGIAKDKAKAKLDGLIKIGKNAAKSDSFLQEYAMLLNSGAHADANPELEIENNDVRCTHSASVGEIDEEKIFYLMSRGLPRKDAKKVMLEGFLNPVLTRIDSEKMRVELEQKIENKYQM